MRSLQRKNNKKTVAIVALAVVACTIAGYLVYRHFSDMNSSVIENGINYSAPSNEEKSTGDAIKQQNASEGAPSQQSTPSTSPSDSNSVVGMDITALNQSSGTLYARALIQTITSEGTCTLTASGPDGGTYTATASVQAGPSSSTCQGFDIPVSSLSPGSWSVTISFQNNALRGSSTKSVVIQ